MKSLLCCTLLGLFLLLSFQKANALSYETDTIKTNSGDLVITFIGHGSLIFTYKGKVIHVDPFTRLADYQAQPKADLVLITHEHPDHLDPKAIELCRTDKTKIVANPAGATLIRDAIALKNGKSITVAGFTIKAVPAYNIVNTLGNGQPFHPKGNGNGYIITFGNKRVYVAGDTEDIPEMRNLGPIDIAFLPMNLPYTMTPEMTTAAANTIKPAILYPYHFGNTDTSQILSLLQNNPKIEVRIRKML